jgi:tetratricopeptide (TPR) repeat protein
VAAGAALAPWASGGSFEYANPYYDDWAGSTEATTAVVPTVLNYSEPIQVPTLAQVQNTDTVIVDDGMAYFDLARTNFMDGKYATAVSETVRALKLLPGDRTIHEFRALCLFAQKKYAEAAAALYAVVVGGPGWDWDTMSALYPDNDTYTQQLRALESYAKKHPRDAKAHFLLGYHYMVLDERDSAREEFSLAAKLQPKDRLSVQLAEALAPSAAAEPGDGE